MNETDLLTVEEMPVSPDVCSPGDKQRLRICVPNISTTLSMGARAPGDAIREEDTGAPHYDGFGVYTRGHVYISAAGAQAESSATLQAQGDVLIQSEKAATLLASGTNTVTHSAQQTIINGGDGLFLCSGIAANPPTNDEPNAELPDTAKSWIGAVESTARGVADWWANIDMWMAGLDIALIAWSTYKDYRSDSLTWKTALFSAVSAATAEFGGGGTLDMVGAGSVFVPGKANGNTIIHGEGGLVMGSPKQAALFSAFGTTIGSATFAGVTAPFAGLLGLRDVEVVGLSGSASIGAKKDVAVTAGGPLELSSKTGVASLTGKTVAVGARAGSGGQAGTDTLALDATKLDINAVSLGLTADDFQITSTGYAAMLSMGDTAAVLGKSAVLHGTDDSTVTSAKKAGLRAGSFLVYATPDKVVLGKAPGTLPSRPAEPSYDKHPKKPNSRRRSVLEAYGAEKKAVAKKNSKKNKKYQKKIQGWKKDVAAMKDASCGIIISGSKIDLVVSGHRLTIDGSSVKHKNFKILK